MQEENIDRFVPERTCHWPCNAHYSHFEFEIKSANDELIQHSLIILPGNKPQTINAPEGLNQVILEGGFD